MKIALSCGAEHPRNFNQNRVHVRSILKILRKLRSRAEHPQNSDQNRAPVRSILKILKKISLSRAEYL